VAWIKVHQTLKDHRKVLQAADELEIETAHMLGLIVSFWLWALDNAPAGRLSGISHRMIARAAQWEGGPDLFVNALINAGFLKDTPDGLVINDWYEYAGKLIDQREAEKNRSRRRRAAAAAAATGDQQTTDGRPQDDQQTTVGREEKSRVEKSRVEKSRKEKTETPPDGSPAPAIEQTPYKEIVAMYHDICKSYPKLRNVSDNRKKAITARWKEYKHNIDTFRELFERAEASSFLKGKNKKNWAADFNWLMNSENMAKVLEGNYTDDKQEGGQQHGAYNERPQQASTGLSGFQMASG
jgi:hypothetical protein